MRVSPQFTLVWLSAFIMLGLLLGAIALEAWRRRRERRRQHEAEWRTVEEIAREKELSPAELDLLKKVIAGHAPKSPLRAVTVRQQFDKCVEDEMESLAAGPDIAALESRGQMLRDIRVRLGLDYIPYGQRIHSTRELYHSQAIWVADKSEPSVKWRRMAVGSIDEALFHLTPQEAGPFPHFRPGDMIECRMWREDDARYSFSAPLVRVGDDPPEWSLRHTNALQRTQSRAHFRVRYEQNAAIGIVNAPVDGDMSDVEERPIVTRLRGRLTSLSGGGLAVIVDQPVPRQVLLRITLDLDVETGPVDTTARIVTTAPVSGGRYLIRAAFAGISDETRDRITHFVFHKQQPIRAIESEAGHHQE